VAAGKGAGAAASQVQGPKDVGAETCAMPLPRSLANLKRETSEKKWAEARQWAGGRTCRTKYRMPKSQRPDGAGLEVPRSSPRGSSRSRRSPASPGSTSTGRRTGSPLSAGGRYRIRTWEHLFKECPEWKAQQKILWAEVRKETGKWKRRWTFWRTKVQPGGAGLPLLYGCGEADTSRGRHGERGVRSGAAGVGGGRGSGG